MQSGVRGDLRDAVLRIRVDAQKGDALGPIVGGQLRQLGP